MLEYISSKLLTPLGPTSLVSSESFKVGAEVFDAFRERGELSVVGLTDY